jgi:hypothetical protein
MAKGQKKSNKEARKPKKGSAKVIAPVVGRKSSLDLTAIEQKN